MAALRSTSRRSRRRYKVKRGGISALLNGVLPAFVFVQQLTSKDQADINAQTTLMGKVKVVSNVITGRIGGLNLFSGVPQYGRTINPSGMANPWTGMSVAALVYGTLGKKWNLPQHGKVNTLGRKMLLPALLGGLFDAPANAPGGANTGSAMQTVFRPGNVDPVNVSNNVAGYSTQNYSYSAMPATTGSQIPTQGMITVGSMN